MLNKYGLFIIIGILLCVSFIPVFSRYQDLAQTKKDIEQKISNLKIENRMLLEEQYRLQNDPVYAESVARKKFNIAKEGEVIYKIVPEE